MQRFIHGGNAVSFLRDNGFSVTVYRTSNGYRFRICLDNEYLGKGYTYEQVARFATAFRIGLFTQTPNLRCGCTNMVILGNEPSDWL